MSKFFRLLSTGYYVCDSWQYLIKTGLLTKSIKATKSTIKLPGQLISFVDMHPLTYQFNIHNMSKEKVEFKLPMTFTVCPIDPMTDLIGFQNYTLKSHNVPSELLRETIAGIVEGETRTFTAGMTIEEMFSDKEAFREKVIKKIEIDMHKIGLTIINANIREMSDFDEHNKYFEYRRQRAIQTANYQAQVDVANAKKEGELGVQERDRDIRIQSAKYQQEYTIQENDRKKEIAVSNAELREIEADSNKRAEIARIKAELSNEMQKYELLKQVEDKRREQEESKFRADLFTKAQIDAEIIERLANAKYYEKEKEADGLKKIYDAQAEGLSKIVNSANNIELATFYLGLQHDVYSKLAHEAAVAVNGLQPKINIWNTGDDSKTNHFTNIIKSFAPMLDQVKDTFFVDNNNIIKKT